MSERRNRSVGGGSQKEGDLLTRTQGWKEKDTPGVKGIPEKTRTETAREQALGREMLSAESF